MHDDSLEEPRWVTRILRLFPHPIFAAIIALASLAVGSIFAIGTVVTVAQGKLSAVFFCMVACVFIAGTCSIFRAMMIRRANTKRRRADSKLVYRISSPVSDAVVDPGKQWSGLPPVPTSHLLFYLASTHVITARIATFLLSVVFGVRIPAILQYTLTALVVVVGILAFRLGREDFQRLRMSGGRMELTQVQVLLVAGAFVAICVTIATSLAIINR